MFSLVWVVVGRRHGAGGLIGVTPAGCRVCGCKKACGDKDQPRLHTHTQKYNSGSVLLSHTIPRAVPSALEGLTTGFGMGPGVSLPLWPPENMGGL